MLRIVLALVTGVVIGAMSFLLINILYIQWADWHYRNTDVRSGMGGLAFSLFLAPVCAVLSAALVLCWPDRSEPEKSADTE